MWGKWRPGAARPKARLARCSCPRRYRGRNRPRGARKACIEPWLGGRRIRAADTAGGGLDGWTARPADFGFYYDLASAVQHGFADDAREALGAVAEALKQSFDAARETGTSQPRITTLGPDYYSPVEIDCLIRWFDMEPSKRDGAGAAGAGRACSGRDVAGSRAGCLAGNTRPDFFGEFTAITTEIVFAKPDAGAKLRFGGASSFALWGALALNVQAHPDWWQYLPRIVHEYSPQPPVRDRARRASGPERSLRDLLFTASGRRPPDRRDLPRRLRIGARGAGDAADRGGP